MPKKVAPKDARQRTKKPAKLADLPTKSLKGKDAAAVRGGTTNREWMVRPAQKIDGIVTNTVSPSQLNVDQTTLKISQ